MLTYQCGIKFNSTGIGEETGNSVPPKGARKVEMRTMKRLLLIAGLSMLGVATADAAPKFKIAADGTTNVADCAKAPAEVRNDCISRARPLSGKEVYAQYGSAKPAAQAAEKVSGATEKAKRRAAEKAAKLAQIKFNKARVASAPKGLKVNSDGTTNIAQCSTVSPSVRNECISRARPLGSKALATFTKERSAAYAKVAAKQAAKEAAAKATVAKAAPAKVEAKAVEKAAPVLNVKGFVIAKDGTTNVADCAKAKPEFKNECISRSRPVTGAQIYGKARNRS